jgi:hypothetical protein
MIGVTLTLGSVVVAAAMGSISEANGSAYAGSSVVQAASGVQLGLVYATVASSSLCPAYQGAGEGTSLTVSVFDYGTAGFTPAEFVVNSTFYGAGYQGVGPGSMAQYSVALSSCAHPSGLTIFAVDARGDEAQFGT